MNAFAGRRRRKRIRGREREKERERERERERGERKGNVANSVTHAVCDRCFNEPNSMLLLFLVLFSVCFSLYHPCLLYILMIYLFFMMPTLICFCSNPYACPPFNFSFFLFFRSFCLIVNQCNGCLNGQPIIAEKKLLNQTTRKER